MEFATFARLDGMVVVIESFGEFLSIVRFCGHKGKAIRRDSFVCETSALTTY